MNHFYVQPQTLTRPKARELAAQLLEFAGPTRPGVFTHYDTTGGALTVSPGSLTGVPLIFEARSKTCLNPPDIDALIEWLHGHRADFPG